MYIVAAGRAFNDIDAFACAIAYAELLRKEDKDAVAAMPGTLNHSVTKLAREQGGEYSDSLLPAKDDKLIYVDLSDPAHFAFPDLSESNVFEVYDHHYGWEVYWTERLGERAHIERVGAAATLIWEEWKKRGYADLISPASANLLLLAILQNTLNFTSTETNVRDTSAFEELLTHATLPEGWQDRYFAECAEGIHTHLDETLKNDTKVIQNYFDNTSFVFSQLEITENPNHFLDRYKDNIDMYWATFQNKKCLVNIADMQSRTSLLYSDDPQWLHAVIEPLFEKTFETSADRIVVAIHQRKQVLKLLQAKE